MVEIHVYDTQLSNDKYLSVNFKHFELITSLMIALIRSLINVNNSWSILSNEIRRSIFLFPFRSISSISLLDRRISFLFRVIDVLYEARSKVYIYISMARRIIFITISIAFLKIDRHTAFMVFVTNLTIPSLYIYCYYCSAIFETFVEDRVISETMNLFGYDHWVKIYMER